MDKRVVVKQNTGFRIFWLVSGLVIMALWVFIISLADGWYVMLITCVFLLPMIAPIYYWRWELVLYKDRFAFRRLFKHQVYFYTQVKCVKEYSSISNNYRNYILIYLLNGKKIEIWHTHMNYDKCRNELLRHMSIEFKRL